MEIASAATTRISISNLVSRIKIYFLNENIKSSITPAWYYVVFSLAYLFAAWLGQVLTLALESGVSLWPPSGLFVAVLLRSETRKIFLNCVILACGADIVSSLFIYHFSLAMAVPIAVGNALEAIAGAFLIRRYIANPFLLNGFKAIIAFIIFSVFISPCLSATAGAATLSVLQGMPYISSWYLWWVGDALGILIFAPLVMGLLDWRHYRWQWLFTAAMLILVLGSGYLVFSGKYPFLYIVIPALVCSSLVLEIPETALVTFALTLLTTVFTGADFGPFAEHTLKNEERQLLVQTFLMTTTIMSLILGGLMKHWRESQRILRVAVAEAETRAELREEQLRKVDRNKDEFLATLAHELRTPLASISNCVTLLKYGIENVTEIYDIVDRQTSQIVRLVDDLMDTSRINSGKVSLELAPVLLSEIVNVAVEASRGAIATAHHQLEIDLWDKPIWLKADRARLIQVVSNLLTNAAKYTPPGGHIRVKIFCDDRGAVLQVEDSGVGIPSHMLEDVFELFTQVNQTLNRAQGGLGIGLSLVKRLVTMHGGTITASSLGSDKGSTFTIWLPRIQTPL